MRPIIVGIIFSLLTLCFANELGQHPHLRKKGGQETGEYTRPGLLEKRDPRIRMVPDAASHNESPTPAMRQRQLQQRRTVLVIRVINAGVEPSVSVSTIRRYIFTDTNSVKAQMMRCSDNTLEFNEAWVGVGGVMDVEVNTPMRPAELKQAARESALRQLGIRDLRSVAHHVLFIFPQIPDYFAEGETGFGLSYYNDHFGVSLAVVMHEIGHNLGLYHSGVPGDEYGDYSGYMGLALVKRGSPLMCYNAANHWDLGWFGSNRRDLGLYGPTKPVNIDLHAFTNAPVQGTVLLKVRGNVYIQYHHASKHNIDSRQEYSNKIVIIEKPPSGPTVRLAALGPGEEFRSSSFVIQACAAKKNGGQNSMEISIGRASTSCEIPTTVASSISSSTQLSTGSWWNWNPVPTTTPLHVANPPQPSPTNWWQQSIINSWW